MGSSCSFKCDEGYGLHGGDQIICTEKGVWSSKMPVCKSESQYIFRNLSFTFNLANSILFLKIVLKVALF